MKKKYLGNTGLLVSEAGFGVLPMGPSQLALPIEEGAAVLRYALERGFNLQLSIIRPIHTSAKRWKTENMMMSSSAQSLSAVIMTA